MFFNVLLTRLLVQNISFKYLKKKSSNDLYVTLYKYIYSETCAILQLSFPTLDKYLCLYGPKVSVFAQIKPEYSSLSRIPLNFLTQAMVKEGLIFTG
jgi:hypothetical protein